MSLEQRERAVAFGRAMAGFGQGAAMVPKQKSARCQFYAPPGSGPRLTFTVSVILSYFTATFSGLILPSSVISSVRSALPSAASLAI